MLVLLICESQLNAGTIDWSIRTSAESGVANRDLSSDGLGNVYVSGWNFTDGNNIETFLSKFDSKGNHLWTDQLSSTSPNASYANSVSADRLGNVFISGDTYGENFANSQQYKLGFNNAFLSKYNSEGNLQWTKLLALNGSSVSFDVSADGLGNAYISGLGEGPFGNPGYGEFLSKYDSAGNLLWSRYLEDGNYDIRRSVSADTLGNVFVSNTSGTKVSKYDSNGNLEWSLEAGKRTGSLSNNYNFNVLSYGISSDDLGNLYVAVDEQIGIDDENEPISDAFLHKYDTQGQLIWKRQLALEGSDAIHGVSADDFGNVYVSGDGIGVVTDSFIRKYDHMGNNLWTTGFTSTGLDEVMGVSAGINGSAYALVIDKRGILPHIFKFSDPIPEPTSAILLTLACGLAGFSRQRK